MYTPSNTSFLGPTGVHSPNGISIGSAVLHSSGLKVPSLQRAAPFPLKIALAHEGCFLGPTPLSIPNGIVVTKTDNKRRRLDIAVSEDRRAEEQEKVNKYHNLARKLERLWKVNTNIILTVVGALRTTSKRMEKNPAESWYNS